MLDKDFSKSVLDKNGCLANPQYEGNVTDIKDEQMGKGIWHRFVTTMEQDIYGGTVCRKYTDGVLTDLTRTAPHAVHSYDPWKNS